MNIQSVGHGQGPPIRPLETPGSLITRQQSSLPGTSETIPTDEPEKPSTDPTPPPPDDEPEESQDKLSGVLRNLQAGHFKGVADVRLRINFFDELSALASQESSTTAQAEVGTLLDTVNEQVDQLVTSLATDNPDIQEAVTGLVSEFDAAVQQAVSDFDGRTGESTESLKEAISLAFTALVDQLRELFVPVSPQEPDAPTDDTDDVTDGQGESGTSDGSTRPPDDTVDTGLGTGELSATSTLTTQATLGEVGDTSVSLPEDDLTTDGTAGTDPTTGDTGDSLGALFDAALETFIAGFDTALTDYMSSIQTVSQLSDPSPPNGNGVAYNKFLAIYDQLRGIESNNVDALA